MCCLFKHALVARCASPVLAFVSFFAYADAVGCGCAGMVEEEVPRLVGDEALPIMLPHALLHTRHRIRYRMRYYICAYAILTACTTAYAPTYVHTRCLKYYSLKLHTAPCPTCSHIHTPKKRFVDQVFGGLIEAGVFPPEEPPNHVLINSYTRGQGIAPHQVLRR